MLETFVPWKPNYDSQRRLALIGEILEKYKAMGIRLTLRQLYYQLVGKAVIANHQREYKRLGELLSNARLGGRLDWHIIEDRVRWPQRASQWSNIQSLVDSAARSYRLPRWSDQPRYVELWCEKDALSSVLSPVADDLHTVLMVNRGYSSTTAMYDASKRIMGTGKPGLVLYLGDFDPSGEDMVRDLQERLRTLGAEVEVRKVALTRPQIDQYKLPPNPAKVTDSRCAGFVAKHGGDSFEVDALPPDHLMELVRKSLEAEMDMPKYKAWLEREKAEVAKLKEIVYQPALPVVEEKEEETDMNTILRIEPMPVKNRRRCAAAMRVFASVVTDKDWSREGICMLEACAAMARGLA